MKKKNSLMKLLLVLPMPEVQPMVLHSELPYYGMIVMISIFMSQNQSQDKQCIMDLKYLQHLVVN